MSIDMTRREILGGSAGLLAVGAPSADGAAAPASSGGGAPAIGSAAGPFLWGVATSAYQIEGGNANSDNWLLENIRPTLFRDPSGDACDFYHRYREDIDLTASLGCNAIRLSVEWARIEPEPGQFSQAALDHYGRLLDYVHEKALAPLVNLVQFSYPRWFAASGGFEKPEAAERFAAYADRVARSLGDRISLAATFNEPNVIEAVTWTPDRLATFMDNPAAQAMRRAAERATGSPAFAAFITGDVEASRPVMIPAHALAVEALRGGSARFPIGVTLAINEEVGVGPGNLAARKRSEVYLPWLRAAAEHGDYIGLQTYTRNRVGPRGTLPLPSDAVLTQAGYEFHPEALEATIDYVMQVTKKPIYITENGVAASDDARRILFIDRALASVVRARARGHDVRGYFHWTLLDCFEGLHGYSRHFGLISIDRHTFKRTPKPSAQHYSKAIRQNLILR